MSDDEQAFRPIGRGRGRARGHAPIQETDLERHVSPSLSPSHSRLAHASVGDSKAPEDLDSTASSTSTFDSDTDQAPRPQGNNTLSTIPPGFVKTHNEKGKAIPLLANYFCIQLKRTIVHDYMVSFEPDVEMLAARRRILFEHLTNELKIQSFAFDGGSNLKCLEDMGSVVKFEGHMKDSDAPISVTVTKTGTVDWASQEMLRTLNVLIRKCFRQLNYALMGRHFFDVNQRAAVQGHGIELIPGFATAVAHHDRGMLMVCDNITKVARLDTVLDLMRKIFTENKNCWKENLKQELCGQIVLTSYNNRTYRVDDIDFNSNPLSTFKKKDAGDMTYVEYYSSRYGVTITDQRQPLIVVMPSKVDQRMGRTDPLYLVPELCKVTGLSESQRANFQLMKAVASTARLNPSDRIEKLKRFSRDFVQNPAVQKNLASWCVDFEPKPVETKGVLLEAEKIYVGQGPNPEPKDYDQFTGDFSRQIRGACMRQPVHFQRVAIIFPQQQDRAVKEFLGTLERVLRPMGCAFNHTSTRLEPIRDDRSASYIQALNKYSGNGDASKAAQILLIILPNNTKERYDAIKKFLCCDVGIPSQVVVAKTISNPKMLMSISTKIGIQMAVKLGAQPWALNIPGRGIMVIGYDTYHESTRKDESVGGFVASMNPELTAWYSRVAFHKSSDEMSSQIAAHLIEALVEYNRRNGYFPAKVIFYRDGVSDGQLPHVIRHEIGHITDSLTKAIAGGSENCPQLSFIVVTKRLSARFFALNNGRIENPPPGTAIDRDVTRADRYDFFLISQSVRQGTVAPTHFNIILETSPSAIAPLRINAHQRLAYKLTHLYFNWNGTIRVPAPCQYAHKLAFLVGTSLHRLPDAKLSDKLFFL